MLSGSNAPLNARFLCIQDGWDEEVRQHSKGEGVKVVQPEGWQVDGWAHHMVLSSAWKRAFRCPRGGFGRSGSESGPSR